VQSPVDQKPGGRRQALGAERNASGNSGADDQHSKVAASLPRRSHLAVDFTNEHLLGRHRSPDANRPPRTWNMASFREATSISLMETTRISA
jgi:hypothetical protein